MKKAIVAMMAMAVAGMMLLGSGSQVMAGQLKADDEMTIFVTDQAGVTECDCKCFPEELAPLTADSFSRTCQCECFLSNGQPGAKFEEKMITLKRPKK
ncbi:MAG: hypothetical protein CVU68_01740 [Deltaproteobacteria bacterium HGW-Deltaproteobacteria-3]|nr:MAG: hypothetical protein CVU68_01740 [Deltaproteobacteria bacterium HGW-Deltaproteobacteria-3]